MDVQVRVHEDFDLGGGYALTQGIHTVPRSELPNYAPAILDGRMFFFKQSTEINALNQQLNEQIYNLYGSDISILPYYDLRDFGAVADGVTNDSPALQAALDAVYDAGGMGVIVFPPLGTTRLATMTSKVFDNAEGMIVFKGSVGSIVYVHGSMDYATKISNMRIAALDNLIVRGSQDATFDANYGIFSFGYVEKVIVNQSVFAGLAVNQTPGVSNVGIVAVEACHLHMIDTLLGGCVSLNGGIVEINASQSLHLEDVFFRDYVKIGNYNYHKGSELGFSQNQVRLDAPVDWNTANNLPDIKFTNVQMDEHHYVAIKLVGTARQNITFDGLTINTGFPFGGGVYGKGIEIETARKVEWKKSWLGYNESADYEAASFEDVALVETDSVQFDPGAKWLSLLGSTQKLVKKYSDFGGNLTYPDGINNEAGAEIEEIN